MYVMRILHITAQKPNSTGSGVYMSGLIESLSKLGHYKLYAFNLTHLSLNSMYDCMIQSFFKYAVIYNSGCRSSGGYCS